MERAMELARWTALVAMVLSGCAGSVEDPELQEEEADLNGVALWVSRSPDRSNPVKLVNQALSGDVYIFSTPQTGVSYTNFYLDDPQRVRAPMSVDRASPYDLNGTASNGSAVPFNLNSLALGAHSLRAQVRGTDGETRSATVTFTVVTGTGTPPPDAGTPPPPPPPPPVDATPPSAPTGLSASDVTSTGFVLTWAAATDNVAVTGYEVFINGTSSGTAASTSAAFSGLQANTAYSARIRACDAAGNWSANSSALSVTTLAAAGTITHGSQLTLADVGVSGTLTPSGSITTTSNGQVIENLVVTGTINIRHSNVTVRNVRVRHGGGANGIVVAAGVTGVLIERCELDGLSEVLGNYGTIGVVVNGRATVRRCYMHHLRCGASVRDGSGAFIENYVRNLVIANGSHNTSASVHGTPGDFQVLRNNFIVGNSAAFSVYSDTGSNINVLLQNNLFVGTGVGYGLYAGYTHVENGYAASNRDIRVIGNRWSGSFAWGPVAAMNMNQPGAVWQDNALMDGTPVLPKQGI